MSYSHPCSYSVIASNLSQSAYAGQITNIQNVPNFSSPFPQVMPSAFSGNPSAENYVPQNYAPSNSPPAPPLNTSYGPAGASYQTPNIGFVPSGIPTPRPSECVAKVELTIRCNQLLDMDVFSKSDPLVVVSMDNGGYFIEKGRTEMVSNCLNPEFSQKIQLDYYFEEIQKLRFSVYDIDNVTPSLEDDDFLGQMECTLGQIVASRPFTQPLIGKGGARMGNSTITHKVVMAGLPSKIYAEELDTGNSELLLLNIRAERLDNLRWFSRSNPFLEFHTRGITGGTRMVYRTEAVRRTLSPTWKAFEIRRQALGGLNIESPIVIKCFDQRTSGSHELIGESHVILGQFLEAQNKSTSWPCINTRKKQRKGNSYANSGIIFLTSCKVIKMYSFLDFVLGGTQINFTVAIDFTASNGDPRDPKSLHYMHPTYPNEYIRAILSVGDVVQDYDSDKQFPALGFGARIPPQFLVSHEFALNFNLSNPYCSGVQGLVDAYKNCLRQVQLYGPTNFAPVINHVAQFAMQAHHQSTPENYFILLILTDGVVTDMPDTLNAVVKASYLPLSIIIVGVGKADFEQMEFLDADGTLLKAPDGTIAKRDIVQFVPFYKFEHGNPAMLAKEVLAELPQQLTEYYRWRNLHPKPPAVFTT